MLEWTALGTIHHSMFYSQSGPIQVPRDIVVGDDALTADSALRILQAGTLIVWQGDFHGARQLLSAIARRISKTRFPPRGTPAELFRLHREERARLAKVLGRLLVPLSAEYVIPLRRAPDVALACAEA
jgi:hypothetical protein